MKTTSSCKRYSLVFMFLCAISAFAQSSGTAFFVRHAEKVSDAQDALLSKTGEQRAACLAQTLRDAHIGAIYVTEVKRTQQTAGPLAKSLELEPIIVKADDTAGLAADIKNDVATKNVLVVGHSDTLPKVLAQMGISNLPPMGRNDYDLLFVVSNLHGKPELT